MVGNGWAQECDHSHDCGRAAAPASCLSDVPLAGLAPNDKCVEGHG